MTRCPQVYLVFDDRGSGKDLLSVIVPRQDFQLVNDLDDREDAGDRGNDNLVARGNG